MDKPARVLLQLNKLDLESGFWLAMIDSADKKEVREVGNLVVAALAVKSYSLLDHQFMQVKVNIQNGKEVQFWIPRNFVKGIVEGKSDLSGAFAFAGKTS